MFSPSKSQSYLIQKQPQNIVSFKEETLALLRQQSQKMRQLKAFISSKDEQLMIKDEQIKFLKETVRQLQDQGEYLIGEKNEMKLKLQKIVDEVKSYNTNVVKPICEEKEQLKKANALLKEVNTQLQKSTSETIKQQSQLQYRLKQVTKQLETTKNLLKQQQINSLELQKKLQKETLSLSKQTEQVFKLTNELNLQSSKRSKLQTEVSALNKQLSSVINKHNSSIKEYEMKISQIMNKKIDVSEVVVYQELVKRKEQQIFQMNAQLNSLNKSHQQVLSKHLSDKDKHLKEIAQLKMTNNQILSDLTNLRKSIQLNRKIVEFQSHLSDTFYSLYQKYQQLSQQNHQLKQQHQEVLNQNQRLSRDVQRLSERLKDSQIQETLIKTQLQQQLQRIQTTYQGKLVSLNLKIRKQEQALQKLNKRQLQAMQHNQHLTNQIHTIQQDFDSYKTTTQKSLHKLNAQNYRILNQMQSLYKICQDNLDKKRIVDKIKHVMNALLTGLYYLQWKIIKNKEKQRNIYLPLLESYLQISNKISSIEYNLKESQSQDEQPSGEKPLIFQPTKKHKKQQQEESKPKEFKESKNLKKFKVAVWVVIGSLRIQKGLDKIGENEKGNSGLNLKLVKAINSRNKTFAMNELMEKEEQAYTNHQEPQTVLSVLLENTQKAFTWPQLNFKHLHLNPYQHLNTLTKIQFLTLQQSKDLNITYQIQK